MARPRHKKLKMKSDTHTKSVFLHGKPNEAKRLALEKLQTHFTEGINFFIGFLNGREDCLMQLLKNDKKDSHMRRLEKENRRKDLMCAYSQSAFDEAVTKLHNRLKEIQKDVIAATDGSILATSIFPLYGVLTGQGREEICAALEKVRDGYGEKGRIAFYDGLINKVRAFTDDEFCFQCKEIRVLWWFLQDEYKVPEVKHAQVKMDANTCKLEKSTDVKTSHVIRVTIPGQERTEIPVNASGDALRRMGQYGISRSMCYTITAKGLMEVTCSFKKKTRTPEEHTVAMGVDTGITDALYCSDGHHYGSLGPVIDFYKDTVEPSFGELSTLRNRKKKLKKFLRTHKDTLPEEIRKRVRIHIDHLEQNIREARKPYRKKRHYYQLLERSVKETVDGYIGSLKGNRSVLTVLELLDIKEFNRSRKENGKYSMFARGRLQEKLMSELEWRGYPFLEVEPAFTSQTCPVCGNLNKENRVGKVFHCTCCGHEDDADHVGSINIRARAEDRELISICDAEKYNKDRRHKAIRALQTKRCQEWQEKNRQGTEQEKTLSREGVQDVSLAFGEWTACMTPPAI